jgi:peroxiredoxin
LACACGGTRAKDGLVKVVSLEEDGTFTTSSVEEMLKVLV